jgi:prepilin-type N-terminal cleavage/methylation domain-containing protein
MKITPFLKLFKRGNSSNNKGFTLTELIVAATISVVVIAAAGYGLMESQKSSRAANTQVDARTEANRALTFISDEIREARRILDTSDRTATGYIYTSSTNKGSLVPTAFSPNGANIQIVLHLQMSHPTDTTRSLDVIYYVKDDEAPWLGPKVIYRWGPNFDANGSYSLASIDTPGSWTHEALIDRVSDQSVSSASCRTGSTGSEIAIVPTNAGFGACVDRTLRSATLLLSRVVDDRTNSIFSTDLKAFARGDSKNTGYSGIEQTTSTASNVTVYEPTPTSTPTTPPTTTRRLRIQQLTASYACSANGAATVTTEVTVTTSTGVVTVYNWANGSATRSDGTTFSDIPYEPTDTVTYVSKFQPTSTNCTLNANQQIAISSTNTNQVERINNNRVLNPSDTKDNILINGKYPNGTPAQDPVATILQNNGMYDASTRTVQLSSRTIDGRTYTGSVLAFEMGQTDRTKAGFDYQDNLIVIWSHQP